MLKVRYFLLVLILLTFFFQGLGQTNTDFWFAAPEVTQGHGDQPIYLRLTSFSQSANVTISEPANTVNFPTQNINIPANGTVTIDLTPNKAQVECQPANTVLNLGLYIHSDVPITAYYEVAHTNNPDLFTLKGNNATGTNFMIPSQDTLYNHAPLTPPAYNSFDIVASNDNTTVTITPSKPIVGHAAGVPFQVTLNRGQVYSAQATGQQGLDHLQGSVVTSDKAVCITVKDDSDQFPGQGCYDLGGDQIVPVNILGTEYIVVRGYTNTTVNDWVFVMATTDNTLVSVNGTNVATLNKGQRYRYKMLNTDLSSYVQTSHPAYVWHLTGYGCETGSAILPPMNCTGSSQVAFTRSTQYSFELIILTKAGAEGFFTLDGSTTLVTAAMFSPVTSNPTYVYARIDFPVANLPVGAHILSNSQDIFHMGIIHTYNAGQAGCSYGYFTDFASLNLGPDQTVCPGVNIHLDAGPNRQSYTWYFNGGIYATGVQTINVSNPGQWSVAVNDHGCMLFDTVVLSNFTPPAPAISGNTSFCLGDSTQLTVNPAYPAYLWSTGATTRTIKVFNAGNYGVSVTDANGCQGSNSVAVSVYARPVVTLAPQGNACSNTSPFPLTGGSPAGGTYSGAGVNSVTGYFDPSSGAGPHLIKYSYTDANGCSSADSNNLTVHDPPAVDLADFNPVCISVPPFALTGGTPAGGVYSGPGVNSGTGMFDPSSGAGPHLITYTYTDANGCVNSQSKTLTVNPLPLVGLGPQPSVCISAVPFALSGGSPAGGTYSGPGVNSATGMFDPSSGAGLHTITYTFTDGNGCTSSASNTLTVNALPSVQLGAFPAVCISASPFLLTGGTPPGGTYSGPGVNSATGIFDPASGAGPHAITYTFTDINGCTNSAVSSLTVNPLPVVSFAPLSDVCITASPFALTSGSPAGGIYSGTGVNSGTGIFSPASAGAGTHSLKYRFTSASGCSDSAFSSIQVIPLPLPAGTVSGPASVCQASSNIPFTLSSPDPLATSFNWEIIPSAAGSVTGTGLAPLVSLNATYTGNAGIRFQPVSTCGTGNFSGLTSFMVNPLPDVSLQSCNDPVSTRGSQPFRLKGGVPPGGIYGIDATPLPTGILDPSTLSVSPPDHNISYTYTNMYGCSVTRTVPLRIRAASSFSCRSLLTDPRDQKTYPTFEVATPSGNRCWMAANLNYGSYLQDNTVQRDNCVWEKYCQGNDAAACTASGGLYQWDELLDYSGTGPAAERKQGLCPPEWHVPSSSDWQELIDASNGNGLAGWVLTDPNPLYGFHALLSGIYYQNSIWAFLPPGFSATLFWTSTVSPNSSARIFSRGMNSFNASVSNYFSLRGNALPVRCVKD
jgi:uncharacterized protein (TIGR02145 family)